MKNFSIEKIVHAFVSLLKIQQVQDLAFVINCDVDYQFEGVRYSYPAPSKTKIYLEKLLLAMISEAIQTNQTIEFIFSEECEEPLGTIAVDLNDQLYKVFQKLPALGMNEEYVFQEPTEFTIANPVLSSNGQIYCELYISQNILNLL